MLVRTRIFFVTDVHGSDRCFRKFINAGKFYSANVLVLGGDITGKMIVLLVKQPGNMWRYDFGGETHVLKSQGEVDAAVKSIKDSGCYPYVAEASEAAELSSNPDMVDGLFKRLMTEGVEEWMKLAAERLEGTGIKCYVSPGNDDYLDIDRVLNSADYVVNPEQRVVEIDGSHEMITLGSSNRTPWNSPREVDEDVLAKKIDSMAEQVADAGKAIWNIHVPPIDTLLDQAPKLDGNLKPVFSSGHVLMASAGSIAVRRSIEEYQPLLGMHGHIHESKGVIKIGRTPCFNPGSEYGSGTLCGLLCDIEEDAVKSYVFTSG